MGAARTDATLTALRLEGVVEHYRSARVVWIGTVIVLTAILWMRQNHIVAITFGLFQAVGYGNIIAAVEVARRDRDAVRATQRLRLITGAAFFLLSLNGALTAAWVRTHGALTTRIEAALMVIGILMFMAMQMHMTRRSYFAALAPPFIALIWMGQIAKVNNPQNTLALPLIVFAGAMIAATWRQQTSDRSLADARLELILKNQELTTHVDEAEAQRRTAEAASRAKTDFLAVTSHEIRTPLNAVLGLAEALRREPLTPPQTAMAQGVLDAGALLTRLLNAVLDITRIEAGKMSLSPAPVDLAAMAETVVSLWQARAQENGITLSLDMTGLPQPCGMMIDGGKLEQTLVNLIANAIKFTPSGGRVQVVLRAVQSAESTSVEVEVADDGPGVPEADRSRIFQAFEQTETGRVEGGAGLGLSICAGVIELMGGDIGVRPSQCGGACFHFSFTAPRAEVVQSSGMVAGPELTVGRPLRILAAEDNAGNRHVLSALLGPLPVALTLVTNGEEALEALGVEAFDLVLMDVNMPVMDGVTALRALRETGGPSAATPVWMLTANVFEEDVTRYRAAGADGVLQKPIDVAALFQLLAVADEKRELAGRTAA